MQKIWIKSDYVSLLLKLFTVSLKFRLLCDMTSKPLMTWRWLPPSACLSPAPTSNLPGYGTHFFFSYKTLLPVVLMFYTSVPLHILLCVFFPLECPSFSWLSFRTISKCSVLPWLPIKSSSANSVLCMVEFLPYYTVVWLFIYTSIPRVLLYVLAHSFISSLLSGHSVKHHTLCCEYNSKQDRSCSWTHEACIKNVCWTEMKSQDSLNFRF